MYERYGITASVSAGVKRCTAVKIKAFISYARFREYSGGRSCKIRAYAADKGAATIEEASKIPVGINSEVNGR